MPFYNKWQISALLLCLWKAKQIRFSEELKTLKPTFSLSVQSADLCQRCILLFRVHFQIKQHYITSGVPSPLVHSI